MPRYSSLYSSQVLPKGFIYPELYLKFVNELELPDQSAWAFPDDLYGQAARAWEARLYWQSEGWLYLDEIDPIPFARNGDWAAFFDGNDHSGDPKIVVVDLGNKKNSYKLPNFEAWYDQALKDFGL